MKKEEARLSQIMKQLIGADEIDVAGGLTELSDLFPKLRDWDYHSMLGQSCRQVGTLLRQNVIDDSVTFGTECFDFLRSGPPDFEQEMLCQPFLDAVRDLADLELSNRAKLPETMTRLETQRGAFQGGRGRTRLLPWERGMEIMINRWIVVCERCGRCAPQERLPRPKVHLRDPRLHPYRDRSEFAMYVELENEGKVDDDFPVLYRIDMRLEDSAPSRPSGNQSVYQFSSQDNIIVRIEVDPTPGELKLGQSESSRLRENLDDPAWRALTVVLEKVSPEAFIADVERVHVKMPIPRVSPRLLIKNLHSPVVKGLLHRDQALSVETKFMTDTGPLVPEPEKAWLYLKFIGARISK